MLQKKYVKSQEQQIVSYNYNDIAEGTGIISLYPFFARNAAGAIYRLTQQALYSEEITSQAVYNSTSYQENFNKTFRLNAFNKPQNIGGTGYFIVPVSVTTGASNQILSCYVIITVQHSDGTTDTDLVSVTSSTLTEATGVSIEQIFNIEAVIPKTHFKIGEYLQVKVQVYSKRDSGNSTNHTATIGHDPQNRDGTGITVSDNIITKMQFDIPFRLDL